MGNPPIAAPALGISIAESTPETRPVRTQRFEISCGRPKIRGMQLQFPPEHPLIIARTQVALPNGAFIRALPLVVDETQRFRVDAMVLCADIVASAYVQMIELALRSKREEAQDEELRS